MTFAAIIAAAAAEAPVNEFGYWDGDPTPWWETGLLMVVMGLLFSPVALLVTWVLFRAGSALPFVTAILAAPSSVGIFLAIRAYNMSGYAKPDEIFPTDLEFLQLLSIMLLVSFLASLTFGQWLKKKRQNAVPEFDPEIFE